MQRLSALIWGTPAAAPESAKTITPEEKKPIDSIPLVAVGKEEDGFVDLQREKEEREKRKADKLAHELADKERLERAESAERKLTQMLVESQRKVEQLQSEKVTLATFLNSVSARKQEELEVSVLELRKHLGRLNSKVGELTDENTSLRGKLDSAEETLETLRLKEEAAQQEVFELKSENERLTHAEEQSRDQVYLKDVKLDEVLDKLSESEKRRRETDTVVSDYARDMQELASLGFEKQEIITTLKADLDEKKEELTEKDEELAHLSKQLDMSSKAILIKDNLFKKMESEKNQFITRLETELKAFRDREREVKIEAKKSIDDQRSPGASRSSREELPRKVKEKYHAKLAEHKAKRAPDSAKEFSYHQKAVAKDRRRKTVDTSYSIASSSGSSFFPARYQPDYAPHAVSTLELTTKIGRGKVNR